MALQKLVAIYTGPGLAVAASNIIRIPTVDGTIKEVFFDFASATDGDAKFNLTLDGVSLVASSDLTIGDGDENVTVSGLSLAISLGSIIALNLETPLPTALPDPPWSLVITYDDGVAVSSSSSSGGFGGMGEDGPPGDSWMIPGPAGVAGSAGSTGATGPAGPQGLPGSDGEQGETILIPGPQGSAGSAGSAGSTGPAGPPGSTGFDGEDGDTIMIPGTQGPQGNAAIGKQTIFIPASAMLSATTNGPSTAQLESATNKLNYSTLDFDGTTQEFAHFQIAMPKCWDEGTITFKYFWATTNASTNGVAIGLQGIAASDGDTIDTAFGTAIYVVDNGQSSAAKQYVSAESGAVTIGGTPAAGDICFFRVTRDPSNGSDDMTQDARLIGIQLFYTTDAVNDA